MNGLEGTSKASKEIMTLHIRAIMVLKTLMTVIIFEFKEDGQHKSGHIYVYGSAVQP